VVKQVKGYISTLQNLQEKYNKLKSNDMKNKIYLFVTLLGILLLTSCEDVYDHVAEPPQAYEQEDQQSVDGFSFAIGSGLSTPVVLTNDLIENETILAAVNTTSTPELAEGAYVKIVLEVSDSEDFENVVAINSAADGNNATILAADLNEAVKTLYGKRPDARQIYLRATYYIVEGTTSSLMPTPAILGPVTVTPVGPVIETEYYIVGSLNGWNIGDLDNWKFYHSGKDVYDDPVFSILVENPGEFKIVPKSSKEAASWDYVFGSYDDTALEGELQADGGNLKVEEPGWVKITLDMMEYKYFIEVIGEMNLTLYAPGGHQEWSPETAPTLYSRNFDFKYEGYVYFADENTEFKFTSQPDWGGTNYGDGGEGGILSDDGGAGNLKITEPGYYKLNVDLSVLPFTYTAVATDWGVIGNATPGGWDNDTDMTYDPETGIWSVTLDLIDGAFKFRANDGWDINLGGDLNNLSYNGSDIPITEGNYTITLDLSNPQQYSATIVQN
jgi:hypothetical protein